MPLKFKIWAADASAVGEEWAIRMQYVEDFSKIQAQMGVEFLKARLDVVLKAQK